MLDTMELNRAQSAATARAIAATTKSESLTKGRSRLSWSVINLALDILLFATFILLCWLAALTQFVFPSGATGDSWRLFGGKVETWRNLQFWMLCLFAIEALIHIMLHWSWVCGVVESQFLSRATGKKTYGDDGGRTIVGVMLLTTTLLLMGIGLGVAAYLMQRVE